MFLETERTTNWIQLYSGKPFYPLEPRAEEVEINDIARSLSMQCRYTGHVKRFYSVAEHCIHLSYAVPEYYALWALLHDGAEAYFADVALPVKQNIPEYAECEERLMRCVAERFHLPWPEPEIVKDYDARIVANEKAALLNPSVKEWGLKREPLPDVVIQSWEPQEAYERFLRRFNELTDGFFG